MECRAIGTITDKRGFLLVLAKIFSHKIFDSKIHSYDTEGKESFLGYFFGPMLLYRLIVLLPAVI